MSAIKFKILDVRLPLSRGEEPFALIRTKVNALADGQGLTVVAPFLPAPLIEMLRSEGFESTVKRRDDGAWAVDFWRN